MTEILDVLTVEPSHPADACVIWLHGLGADGYDFVNVVSSLGLSKHHTIKFIFPHAPKKPVTVNGGLVMPAWYDISAMDLNIVQDEQGIRNSERSLRLLIDQILNEGIVSERIIIIGFSQGGALALHTALRLEKPLAGVGALSAYLPLHDFLEKERSSANKHIPIFMSHGYMDPVVPYHLGQTSYTCLQSLGYEPKWQGYPMLHTVSLPQLNDIGQWIQRVLLIQS